tara:strand:+ start:7248 stop:7832 length:585 start_codon:yes stop_codon:yes gene_type:complete
VSKTFEKASEFPLQWPAHWPETKTRQSSRFDTLLFQALENVKGEIERFAKDSGKRVTDIIISSNYSLTNTKPDNPGVCVYFTWDGEQTCIPVDRYSLVQDNLQAIYHCINAERTKLRHGGINLVKAAFRGYAALPNPNNVNWRDILNCHGVDNLEDVKRAYRSAIKNCHTDKGGNHERAVLVNAAWEQAQKELK